MYLIFNRVTNLSIETMMKNSFREFGVQSKASTHKLEMENLKKLINNFKKTPNFEFIGYFCETVANYIQELTDIMPVVISQKTKEIGIGKVLVICYEKYAFSLGIVVGFTGKYHQFKFSCIKKCIKMNMKGFIKKKVWCYQVSE